MQDDWTPPPEPHVSNRPGGSGNTNRNIQGEKNTPEKNTPALFIPREADSVEASIMRADALPLNITEEDLAPVEISEFEKKGFQHEMHCCDMYLQNLHNNFRFTSSIGSVIQNVQACLTVHRHKREVMRDLSGLREKGDDLPVVDAMGRPVIARR